MVLNRWGQIVAEEWRRTEVLRTNVQLDAFVKSVVTRRVNRMRGVSGRTVWQRYFERILRNEREWHACRCYIEANPRRWFSDVYYATDAEPAEGMA